MNAYKVEAVLTKDGTLVIEGLPFQSGDAVEIIVLEKANSEIVVSTSHYDSPLKGSVLRYEDPLAPAIPAEEWDVLR